MHSDAILLVDDDQDFCDLIRDCLKDDYAHVDICGDIETAKTYLNETKYGALLLDINLRGQNGGEILKYLRDSEDHLNHDVPTILISAHLTPEFITKNKPKYADILAKPFSNEDLLQTLARVIIKPESEDDLSNLDSDEDEHLDLSMALQSDATQANAEAASDFVFKEVPFNKPFDVHPELKNAVVTVLKQLNQNPGLKKIFEFLKITKGNDSYYNKHIGILLNVSAAIATELQVAFGPYLEKLVYATYLHDLSFIEKPHLARISTLEQLEQQKGKLQFREDREVLDHPEWMASQLEKIQGIPPDSITIVRQHHELPDGSGFPNAFTFKRIFHMSIVFIIAHDFTEYMIDNPDWDLKLYYQTASHKFSGGQFLKTLSALAQCK